MPAMSMNEREARKFLLSLLSGEKAETFVTRDRWSVGESLVTVRRSFGRFSVYHWAARSDESTGTEAVKTLAYITGTSDPRSIVVRLEAMARV